MHHQPGGGALNGWAAFHCYTRGRTRRSTPLPAFLACCSGSLLKVRDMKMDKGWYLALISHSGIQVNPGEVSTAPDA